MVSSGPAGCPGSVITRAVSGRSPDAADARKRGSSSTSPVSADHRCREQDDDDPTPPRTYPNPLS